MGKRRGACRILVKEHLEDLGEDRRIILNLIFKNWDGVIDWIDLTEDRNRRRAFVNVVMKLSGSTKCVANLE
jgi:hypothetical protein